MHYLFKDRPYKQAKKRKKTQFTPYFLDEEETQALATPEIRSFYTNNGLTELFEVIPQIERFNLHLTLWHSDISLKQVGTSTYWGRDCNTLPVIAWDLDDCLEQEKDQVIEATLQALALNPEQLAIVWSGNGLHFVLPIEDIDKKYLDSHFEAYKQTCANIQQKLFEKGLSGTVDPMSFTENKTLRLPNTTNLKQPNELEPPITKACVLLYEMPDQNQVFSWPDSSHGFNENYVAVKELPPVDGTSVLSGCDFLKHCKDKSTELSEPEWYAMISTMAFIPRGAELIHEYSEPHPRYSKRETDSKITQAKRMTGPRTCASINKIFPGCEQCPNFGKVRTPVQIHAADFVLTANTGYWFLSKEGKPTKADYEGLLVEFNKEYKYIIPIDRGKLYKWTGTHFEYVSPEVIKHWIEHKMYPKPEEQVRTEFFRKVMLRNLVKQNYFVDTTQNKINMANGVLDLKTHELLAHDPKYGFLNVHPYAYDPTATCPVFDSFLDTIMLSRQDSIDFILEWFGYCLENSPVWQEIAVFFVGEGANGKSTLATVMRTVFGEENICYANAADLNREYYRVKLEGAKLNISEETPSKQSLQSSMLKALTTKDTKISAREIYGKEYYFTNRCKILFLSNHTPQSDDKTDGFMRRVVILPFDKYFSEADRDYHITDKLLPEAAGILNKLLVALKALKKRGHFDLPTSHKDALEAYKEDNDLVHTFIKYRLDITGSDKDFVLNDTLYEEYLEHAKDTTGDQNASRYASKNWIMRRILSKNKGKLTLKQSGASETRGKRVIVGLKLQKFINPERKLLNEIEIKK